MLTMWIMVGVGALCLAVGAVLGALLGRALTLRAARALIDRSRRVKLVRVRPTRDDDLVVGQHWQLNGVGQVRITDFYRSQFRSSSLVFYASSGSLSNSAQIDAFLKNAWREEEVEIDPDAEIAHALESGRAAVKALEQARDPGPGRTDPPGSGQAARPRSARS